jgi:hypothetical protein
MLLENFHPQSKPVAKTTLVDKPHFPVIDAHNQLGEAFGGGRGKLGEDLSAYVAEHLHSQKEGGSFGLKIWNRSGCTSAISMASSSKWMTCALTRSGRLPENRKCQCLFMYNAAKLLKFPTI